MLRGSLTCRLRCILPRTSQGEEESDPGSVTNSQTPKEVYCVATMNGAQFATGIWRNTGKIGRMMLIKQAQANLPSKHSSRPHDHHMSRFSKPLSARWPSATPFRMRPFSRILDSIHEQTCMLSPAVLHRSPTMGRLQVPPAITHTSRWAPGRWL